MAQVAAASEALARKGRASLYRIGGVAVGLIILLGVVNAATHGDLLAPLPAPVDLIVANLPYIGEDEYNSLGRDVRLYEPRGVLVGGREGHELMGRLLAAAPASLRVPGAILLELGPAQARATLAAAHDTFPGATIQREDDYAGLAR